MSGQVHGAELLAKNILVFTRRFLDEVNKDMQQAQFTLDQAVTKNISLRDHTLDDLRRLGHPYSRLSPNSIHEPEYQVHRQSGELLRGKYSGVNKASVSGGSLTASAYVGVSESVEHAVYVIYGTSKMIPRDFLYGSLNEVKDGIINILKRSLNGVIVSFDGERIKL